MTKGARKNRDKRTIRGRDSTQEFSLDNVTEPSGSADRSQSFTYLPTGAGKWAKTSHVLASNALPPLPLVVPLDPQHHPHRDSLEDMTMDLGDVTGNHVGNEGKDSSVSGTLVTDLDNWVMSDTFDAEEFFFDSSPSRADVEDATNAEAMAAVEEEDILAGVRGNYDAESLLTTHTDI
jgi:hypothetical protein